MTGTVLIKITLGMLAIFFLIRLAYWQSPAGVAVLFSIIAYCLIFSAYNIVAFFRGMTMYWYGPVAPSRPVMRTVLLAFYLVASAPLGFIVFRAVAVQVGAIPVGGSA